VPLLALLPALALVALWGEAVLLYPVLPERIPIHFDGAGTPDRFVDRSPLHWYLLPVIATVLALVVAYGLPARIRRMAASGSAYLNVPRKKDFLRLPPDARVRAIRPTIVLLRLVVLEMVVLFALILHGSAKVATDEWHTLPSLPMWVMVGALVLTPFLFLPLGRAAVLHELEHVR